MITLVVKGYLILCIDVMLQGRVGDTMAARSITSGNSRPDDDDARKHYVKNAFEDLDLRQTEDGWFVLISRWLPSDPSQQMATVGSKSNPTESAARLIGNSLHVGCEIHHETNLPDRHDDSLAHLQTGQ